MSFVHAHPENLDDGRLVRVCDHCLMASCWLYMFPCDRAITAGTTTRSVSELRALDREHPSYWLDPGAQPTFDAQAIAKRVGARLRELRLDAELSQADIAQRMRSHRPIISRLERGVQLQTLDQVTHYAAVLELDVATVLVCLDERWHQGAVRERLLVARSINELSPEIAA